MTKVFSFIKLDFCLIKAYRKGLALLLGLGLIMGFAFRSAATLSSFLMAMLMITLSYPFAIGEKNRLDILYSTLSLNRKNIVIGRYLFILLFILAGAVLSFLCSLLLSAILRQEIMVSENILSVCVIFAVLCVIVAVQYPIYFKLGYTKAKFAALIPMFLIFFCVLTLPMLIDLLKLDLSFESFLNNILQHTALVAALSVLVGLAALALSCYISYKVYDKKDL